MWILEDFRNTFVIELAALKIFFHHQEVSLKLPAAFRKIGILKSIFIQAVFKAIES
jgi:hypothetical protein